MAMLKIYLNYISISEDFNSRSAVASERIKIVDYSFSSLQVIYLLLEKGSKLLWILESTSISD